MFSRRQLKGSERLRFAFCIRHGIPCSIDKIALALGFCLFVLEFSTAQYGRIPTTMKAPNQHNAAILKMCSARGKKKKSHSLVISCRRGTEWGQQVGERREVMWWDPQWGQSQGVGRFQGIAIFLFYIYIYNSLTLTGLAWYITSAGLLSKTKRPIVIKYCMCVMCTASWQGFHSPSYKF